MWAALSVPNIWNVWKMWNIEILSPLVCSVQNIRLWFIFISNLNSNNFKSIYRTKSTSTIVWSRKQFYIFIVVFRIFDGCWKMAINVVPLLWIGSLLTEMAPFAALQLSFPCLLANEWHTLIQLKSCIYSVTSNETLRRIQNTLCTMFIVVNA